MDKLKLILEQQQCLPFHCQRAYTVSPLFTKDGYLLKTKKSNLLIKMSTQKAKAVLTLAS